MEGLGLLQLSVNDREGALASFPQARSYYGKSDDALRVAIHEMIQLRAAGREAEVKSLADKMIAAVPNSPAVDLLRALALPPLPPPLPAAAPAPASASAPPQR